MSAESSKSSAGGIDLGVMLAGHRLIDFDKKKIRKALNQGAAEVRKAARRLVARRAISSPEDFPGKDSGALMRSIKIYKRGSKGGYVKLGPTKTSEMDVFYPAFLHYGSSKIGLKKRGNYMTVALEQKRESVRSNIRTALEDSLVPRK